MTGVAFPDSMGSLRTTRSSLFYFPATSTGRSLWLTNGDNTYALTVRPKPMSNDRLTLQGEDYSANTSPKAPTRPLLTQEDLDQAAYSLTLGLDIPAAG